MVSPVLDSIKSFFANKMSESSVAPEQSAPDGPPKIHVAACALLLELAYADDEFSPTERAHLETTIQRHFNLDEETSRALISLADTERVQAVDLFQFTSLIARDYDEAQKMVLLEAMWGLVFADGVVARHEASLMRRVSKLLDVKPGFLAEARRRAGD